MIPDKPLRAVVIGTGWAGEGHTLALRDAGVEVVALCGRTPGPAQAMAAKLGIQDLRFDWRQALAELQPEIVAIATPAAPHREMAEAAAQLGCHVLCEKPLGVDAVEAQTMLAAVEQAGVKHAYASTSRYGPACIYAQQLVVEGLIGPVREVESVEHFDLPATLSYSWLHSLALGGGALNNALSHKLGQVVHITGGRISAVAGEARVLLARAPVGEAVHDFRENFGQLVQPDATTEWRAVDADMAYTVLAQLELSDGSQASALFRTSAMAVSRHARYLAFYGERGTLHLSGPNSPNRIEHYDRATKEWQELPMPAEVVARLPQVEDAVQRDWHQLCREFVADIRGAGYSGYPTFHEGWLHNTIFDIVRRGAGWTALPILAAQHDESGVELTAMV